MTALLRLTCVAAAIPILPATTLEKLSIDQMVEKSTSIIRGKVVPSHVQRHGAIHYSHYKVQVTEQLKGPAAAIVDVVLPGGSIGSSLQRFSGVPQLAQNAELVLFLWTSKSGLTHIIGLSQGILQVTKDSAGQTILIRQPILEGIVNSATGRPVTDTGMRMTMTDLANRVRLAGEGK